MMRQPSQSTGSALLAEPSPGPGAEPEVAIIVGGNWGETERPEWAMNDSRCLSDLDILYIYYIQV